MEWTPAHFPALICADHGAAFDSSMRSKRTHTSTALCSKRPPPPPPPSMRSPRQERVHMLASRRALLCMCTSSPRTGSSFHSSRRTWRPSRRRELIRMWMARPIRATGLRRSLSAASISCPRPHVHCALVSALIREDGMGCHCTSVPVRVLLLNQELFIKQPSSRSSGT